ncbi:hypothetical protein IAI10_17700 [Clostridium sp. 19966]|uniref:hypothetical protein n=1 Tax=Clostridium sp. 19966 TaxID=2768166 RepID=UPI0028DD5C9E|nr:hypothetical protein [Clostridium sp. 19966]MDT8718503.1 hypothetical protein [Clostridium sp. 19966]
MLSSIIIALNGYLLKKIHLLENSETIKNLENEVENFIGTDNTTKFEKIVKDSVVEVEQLAKEGLVENVSGRKYAKAIELIENDLPKIGLTVTDGEIYNLIKTTVGYMNEKK